MKTILVVQLVDEQAPAAKPRHSKASCCTIEFRGEDHEVIPAELAYAGACKEVGCDCAMRLGKN